MSWRFLTCAALFVTCLLTANTIGATQFAYDEVLGQTPRILLASFAAYLVGEFANAFVLAKMKIATRGRWLWTRTIGSTVVGQALDSAVFVTLAFWGTLPAGVLTG